jgi:5-formyltetrahydrofolate cyclo-ligase
VLDNIELRGTDITDIGMMKDEIRKAISTKRASLRISECLRKSRKIKAKLFSLAEFRESSRVLFYMAMPKEVQTKDMVLEATRIGKTVVLPRIAPNGDALMLSEVKDIEKELEPGLFGIPEPKQEFYRPVALAEVDLIIMPGVAFDLSGHRMGFGKGFYDKLLGRANGPISTIGLAFDFQLLPEIPVLKHDVKLCKIITEKRIISCCYKTFISFQDQLRIQDI